MIAVNRAGREENSSDSRKNRLAGPANRIRITA